MKKIVAVFTSVAFILALSGMLTLSYAADKMLEGAVTKVTGKVSVRHSKVKTWEPVEVNMPVKAGDTIVTTPESEVEIIMDDGTVLRLEQRTAIVIEESSINKTTGKKSVDINLKSGKLLNNIEKLIKRESKYRVKTPTAVIGVRGTEFATEVSTSNKTTVAVYGGTVAVKASESEDEDDDAEIAVGTEQETSIEAGQKKPAEPTGLSEESKNYYADKVAEFEKRVQANRERLEEIIAAKQAYIENKVKEKSQKIEDRKKKFEDMQKKMEQGTEE
ncbi:MAG: FecR family protein [Elusimicrobiota bacterium]